MSVETWTDDAERFVAISYDDRGVCEVTREAMRALLARAGFSQAPNPTTDALAAAPGAGHLYWCAWLVNAGNLCDCGGRPRPTTTPTTHEAAAVAETRTDEHA